MKKKIFTMALLIVLLIITTNVVTAASFTSKVQLSKTTANPGDEVVATLSISNIDKGDKDGTNAISGTIGFDSNALTYVSYTVADGWSMQAYNESTGTFAITKNDYTTESQAIMVITFKVKDNASAANTEIKLTNVQAGFGQAADITNAETVTATDTSATLKITTTTQTQPGNNTPSENTITSNTAPTNQTPLVTSNVVNANQSDKTIPQTGISDFILPAVVVLGIIAVISYIRYKKYKNI